MAADDDRAADDSRAAAADRAAAEMAEAAARVMARWEAARRAEIERLVAMAGAHAAEDIEAVAEAAVDVAELGERLRGASSRLQRVAADVRRVGVAPGIGDALIRVAVDAERVLALAVEMVEAVETLEMMADLVRYDLPDELARRSWWMTGDDKDASMERAQARAEGLAAAMNTIRWRGGRWRKARRG